MRGKNIPETHIFTFNPRSVEFQKPGVLTSRPAGVKGMLIRRQFDDGGGGGGGGKQCGYKTRYPNSNKSKNLGTQQV